MQHDKEIQKYIAAEAKRQNETLDLIASENIVSPEVLRALATSLANKYSEGYPGKRYYPGNENCDAIEELAKARALKMFKLSEKTWHVNVQPYSGSPANVAILLALANPGETIMGMALSSGGHLTHGHKVSITGKVWRAAQYGVSKETGLIDYDALRALAEQEKPKVIISGFTAYPRKVDFKKIGDIAKAVGAFHVADISHIAGLVVAGAHPSPFPHADVVMTTTHKTLRGPRGAMIICKKELAEKIDKAVFPGMQGGPHNNVIAAKAIAFAEALEPAFKKYGEQVVKNAKALATALKKRGFTLVTDGTDTHLILADMVSYGLTGKEAEERFENVGIIANRNTIPGDESPFNPSGIRLGTASLTTRGMKEKEMETVASLMVDALTERPNTAEKVIKLCKKFPAFKSQKK